MSIGLRPPSSVIAPRRASRSLWSDACRRLRRNRMAVVAVGFLVLLAFWIAFWAGGVRLLMAGLRQTLRPELTTQQIFGIKGDEVLPVMREVGFANLAMGTLGVLSVLDRSLLVPAALVSGLYYGFAGLGHLFQGGLNLKRRVAMLTDLWVFAVLAVYLASTFTS